MGTDSERDIHMDRDAHTENTDKDNGKATRRQTDRHAHADTHTCSSFKFTRTQTQSTDKKQAKALTQADMSERK